MVIERECGRPNCNGLPTRPHRDPREPLSAWHQVVRPRAKDQ
jgi:hypothetical protein